MHDVTMTTTEWRRSRRKYNNKNSFLFSLSLEKWFNNKKTKTENVKLARGSRTPNRFRFIPIPQSSMFSFQIHSKPIFTFCFSFSSGVTSWTGIDRRITDPDTFQQISETVSHVKLNCYSPVFIRFIWLCFCFWLSTHLLLCFWLLKCRNCPFHSPIQCERDF